MNAEPASSAPAQFKQRAIAIVRSEGLAGLGRRVVDRLRRRPRQVSSFVVTWILDRVPAHAAEIDLGIRSISAADADLSDVARLWYWAKSKEDLLARLADGQQCYIAEHQGRIVAGMWVTGNFYEEGHARQFTLADEDVYVMDGFTLPEFRGKNVILQLSSYAARDLVERHGKRRAWALIDITNRPSQRAAAKGRRELAGVTGFIEVLGIRFYYLIGRNAFPKTRKRFYVERL